MALVLVVGCDFLEDISGVLFELDRAYLIGVDGDHVFYEYERESDADCNEWGFCDYPTSLWLFDMATGESRRIQRPVFQCGAQAYGDYFVRERYFDDDSGRVEAVQISTGERTTIIERSAIERREPLYFQCQHILDGQRVMVLRLGELLLFDLAAKSVIWTFDVPAEFNELSAFGGDYAVVSSIDTESYEWRADLLIDITTDETIDIPPPPDGINFSDGPYYDARYTSLSTGWLVGTGWRDGGQDRDLCILGFHLSTQTWHVVVGPDSPVPPDWVPYLFGVSDGSFVILWDNEPPDLPLNWGNARIDVVDPQTGDTRIVSEDRAILGLLDYWSLGNARVHDNKIYWIDEYDISGGLVILDLDTGRLQTRQLGGPFED